MKILWILGITLLLTMSSAVAQSHCTTAPLPDCSSWADVNFLTCTGNTGNDSVNDFDALQDAFCCLKSHGGTLVFPADGVCTHEKEITIKVGKSFHIDGNGATLKNVNSASVTAPGYGGIRIEETDDFSIRNLILDGNRAGRDPDDDTIEEKANHLLLLRGVEDVEIENVRAINSVADGFYLRSDTPTATEQDLQRVRLLAVSSDNSWRHGLSIVSGQDIQVLGGTFSNANGAFNSLNSRYFSGGARIETNPTSEGADPNDAISDVLIQGARFHDNEAVGIHLRQAPDQPVENVRILGNSLSANARGQLLLDGRRILVADNQIRDFTYDEDRSQTAGILVLATAEEVLVQGNTLSDIVPGPLDVLEVEDGVEDFEASGNVFRDVLLSGSPGDVSASAPTVIRTSSPGSVITGNTFQNSDIRGILVDSNAPNSVISGNSFFGMDRNVIYINGEDTILSGNTIADPRGTAGSGKAESVIRVRSDLGTAEGNAIACSSSSQRGFIFEKNPVLVRDNVGKGCNCTGSFWLQVEGTGTTYGTSDNYCYP